MNGKKWWTSKTLWANSIAALAILVQLKTGLVIDGEAQGAILVLMNIVLRFMTKEPIAPLVGGKQ